MTGLTSLNWLIGTQALSDHVVARVDELVGKGTEYAQACATVTDALDADEAWAIAATRQTWIRRHDTGADDAPILRLYVLERNGSSVMVADLDIDWDPDAGRHVALHPQHTNLANEDEGAVIDIDLPRLLTTVYAHVQLCLQRDAINTLGTALDGPVLAKTVSADGDEPQSSGRSRPLTLPSTTAVRHY
ncbi:hypothetical protein [Streptomyces sp. NPDC059979]|uniref:hypothetical protein n=1 Tax=Streptomyces sp. NPDC059979 TaxID=3347021 RepID=UPI0036C6E4C4